MLKPSINPKNIIVRMPNWLGDAVMASPLIKDLRLKFPSSNITLMCQSNISPLFIKDKNVDEILTFQKQNGWIHGANRDIVYPLRYGKFDLGILTTNSFSSAWWFWLGKVKNKIGYALNFRSFFLDYPLIFPIEAETQHQVITYKRLLEPLNIPISNTLPYIEISDDEKILARETLEKYGLSRKDTLIGINPGAAFGTAKCWPPHRFKELTEKLIKDTSKKVVFFGDQSGESLIKEICTNLPDSVINLSGKTNLRELIALIDQCNIFLSNDSGPMHIAAALKVPLVALFGSTNDIKTGPYEHGTVIHKHVACSPCYKRVCPIDFKCMTRIQVEEVYQLILEKLFKKDERD